MFFSIFLMQTVSTLNVCMQVLFILTVSLTIYPIITLAVKLTINSTVQERVKCYTVIITA